MSELVSLTTQGEIAVITVNNPPVNALSPGVPEGIAESIEKIQSDDSVKAAVLIGGGRTFIAGADIKEFGKMTSGKTDRGPGFNPILNKIEQSAKPVVAAIHGTALGGGLETSMACHYRVAVPSAQVGQPEVKLGIIPGAGGTQRLPRLIGTVKAAEMCAIGDPIGAQQAHELGVIDRVIDGDLLEGAVAFAKELVAGGKPLRRTCELSEKLVSPDESKEALDELRKKCARRMRGQPAALAAIEAVEAASTMPFDEGLATEQRLFFECLHSNESKSLIHVFFGTRAVRKVPDVSKDTPTKKIEQAAVVGAGTMGGGIAMVYANAGIPVVLKEAEQDALDRGVARIRGNYEATMKKGRLSAADVAKRMSLITPTLFYDGFEGADIIVEAVFEEMDLKKKTFKELDAVAKPDAILASNTSYLNIDEIAAQTKRPQQVIGNHFFSPANVMPLLEIVRGRESSKETVATAMALAGRLRKVGVLVGNCHGFVGNRMYSPYQREAQFLVEEGAKVEEVDKALYDFGMAMGPLAVGDLAGLDIGWRIRKQFAHTVPEGMRQPLVAVQLCEQGRYGQKTGAGWYRYVEGSRAPQPDPEVESLIEKSATEAGIKRRSISPEEIVERTIYALVNEGAQVLDEGMALRAVDIDIIYVNGYGFPAQRGGPMFFADTVGLKKVCDRIRQFESEQGFWWKPSALLKRLADEGKTFAQFDRERAS